MEYKELFEKYQLTIEENKKLKEENRILRSRLVELECNNTVKAEVSKSKEEIEILSNDDTIEITTSNITNKSDTAEKIRLFMSLFKGRTDVYAKGWPNKKTGKYGYSPFCSNEWSPGLCSKPSGSCTNCLNKLFQSMDEKVMDNHLSGKTIVGIYPMCADETCYFLAIDFDGTDWEKDSSAIREVCREFDMPAAVERSRSGEGGHIWFFF